MTTNFNVKTLSKHGRAAVLELQAPGVTLVMGGRIATQVDMPALAAGKCTPPNLVAYLLRLRADTVRILRRNPGHYATIAAQLFAAARALNPDVVTIFATRSAGVRSYPLLDALLADEARAARAQWFVLNARANETALTMDTRVRAVEAHLGNVPPQERPAVIPCLSMEAADVAFELSNLAGMGHRGAFLEFHGWSHPKTEANVAKVGTVIDKAQIWVGALQVPATTNSPEYVVAPSVCHLYGIQAAATFMAASGGEVPPPLVTANRKRWALPASGKTEKRKAMAFAVPAGGTPSVTDLRSDPQVLASGDTYKLYKRHDYELGTVEANALRDAILMGSVPTFLGARPELQKIVARLP